MTALTAVVVSRVMTTTRAEAAATIGAATTATTIGMTTDDGRVRD
jgi:hypothetical protein